MAVLGYVFGHFDNFEECLTKKSVPHLSTTGNVPDAQVLAQYPLLVDLATPRIERRSKEKIDGALATNVIGKGTRLGAVIDACPGTGRAWTNVTKPYLESKGVIIAFDLRDRMRRWGRRRRPRGGPGPWSRPSVPHRQRGDRRSVRRVGGSTCAGHRQRGRGARTGTRSTSCPRWRGRRSSAARSPPVRRQTFTAMGGCRCWMSSRTAGRRRRHRPGAASPWRRPRTSSSSAPADYAFAFNLCESLFVYEAALKATSGRTDGPAVVGAIEALGSSHPGALTLEGRLTFGPRRHDAPSYARYLSWDGGCSCFIYRSYAFSFRLM